MSRPIRAAVCHAFGAPLSVETVHLRAPGPGEVEVTLGAVALCHSDISYAEGAWGGALPAIYGHEAAGHVSALGPGVNGYSIGDPVLVTLLRSCGTCPSCSAAHPATCETPPNLPAPLHLPDGQAVAQGLACGAFAEAVLVTPAQLAPLPADIPLEAACLLACSVTTGVGAVVQSGQVRVGETVVVIGAGGVGLNVIQGARLAGAARIIAVDLLPRKLDEARDFGATDVILASAEKPWALARAVTGRGADAVFVTVGATAVYDTAPRYLARGGRMVMVGMPHSGETARYEPVILAMCGQDLRGSMMGDTVLARDIPWMVDLWRQGRLMLEPLISGRWSLDQINAAIADTNSGQARRNVIVFD
ncbi:zinc-binding dehydrogenase [Dinoroseobacter sp. S375]|uniref:zinc-binding dehydrogenase n=1 Tax=Dinoroseobacter sp. S375 TaxID=3415136 RepID=UPI003C7AF991